MRFLFLVIALLSPRVLLAQLNIFAQFKPGTYTLAKSPTTHIQAELKLRNGDVLLTKDATGKKEKLTPTEVLSFIIDKRKFIATNGVESSTDPFATTSNLKFVELLDSGQVMLMRYEYTRAVGTTAGSSQQIIIYLLRRPNEAEVTSLSGAWLGGIGKKGREILIPYLTTRPDLVKIAEEQLFDMEDIIPLIHALNTGLPYANAKP